MRKSTRNWNKIALTGSSVVASIALVVVASIYGFSALANEDRGSSGSNESKEPSRENTKKFCGHSGLYLLDESLVDFEDAAKIAIDLRNGIDEIVVAADESDASKLKRLYSNRATSLQAFSEASEGKQWIERQDLLSCLFTDPSVSKRCKDALVSYDKARLSLGRITDVNYFYSESTETLVSAVAEDNGPAFKSEKARLVKKDSELSTSISEMRSSIKDYKRFSKPVDNFTGVCTS